LASFGRKRFAPIKREPASDDLRAEVSANAEKAARSLSVKACDSGEFQVALSVHSLN